MKASLRHLFFLILLATPSLLSVLRAENFPISLRNSGTVVELSWPTTVIGTNQGVVYPEYEVEYSRDLVQWTNSGARLRGIAGRSAATFNLRFDQELGPFFYRVHANLNPRDSDRMGNGGAEVFGYSAKFDEELARIGLIPIDDFATNGPGTTYLPQLSWDPTTARYWSNFYSTNMFVDLGGNPNFPRFKLYSYRLDTNELAMFMTNGFVVSERMGSWTFGDAYYRIFHAELPVFITADSCLHAWHRTYQSMLEELEEVQLCTLLERILINMSSGMPAVWQRDGSGPLRDSILDTDYFITVARSLWTGAQVPSALRQATIDSQVAQTLAGVQALEVTEVPMFGSTRTVDFSQFKPRGHYDASERLRHYFRTMMWCGRTDLRVVTFPPNEEDDVRQLGTALTMYFILRDVGQINSWSALEQIIRAFVGVTDSMTFEQLGQLLAAANIKSMADVPDLSTLRNLQTLLLSGQLGIQSIHGDFAYSPLGTGQVKLPRSFTFCGQKFTMDTWTTSQVVYDRITNSVDGKVLRRKPSCLDVAFAVFGNSQVVPDIVRRIKDETGVPFRDGLPYQHNLLAVRNTIESQETSAWTDNIYTAWLSALRALSAPTTDSIYPEAMRTRAWVMKTLNTQLASWTELRHDTVLYVKQSYTEPVTCYYPYGFVEPRPEFWGKMSELANISANALSKLSLSGSVTIPSRTTLFDTYVTFDLAQLKAAQIAFFGQFSSRMLTLKSIAQKELAQQSLSYIENAFLQDVVEMRSEGYTGERRWNGWYPGLCYTNGLGGMVAPQRPGCALWDPMVADVHTDLPSPVVGDPGCVLHEAVGNVPIMLIAIDNGPDRMIYAGPTLTHYEFEEPGVRRLSDDDWKTRLMSDQKPAAPEWTRSYFVPGSASSSP